jgi:pimeloyl-ACP methyl ester carboxylesterase
VKTEHHRLVANGVDLHFVTAGSGPPLILIHGFPQTWYQWRHVIDRLADRFTIIAPDLRGIGASPGPATGYDKPSLAGDVNAIVAQVCGDEPAFVVGHDMGSFVAFTYALRYRQQVKGLMLVDAPPPGTTIFESGKTRAWHIAFHCQRDVAEMLVAGKERAYISQFIASRIYDTGAISEQDIDIYAAAYRAPGAMRAAFEMYRALDEDAQLNRAALEQGRLAMPVIVLAAAGRMNRAQLEQLGPEIAEDLQVTLVDRCGHWISEEQPDVLAMAISALAKTASSQPDPIDRGTSQ